MSRRLIRSAPGSQGGFTLLELLVVLVIVSIISVGSYSLLDTFFSTDRVLTGRSEEMRRLSMAMYRLDDDFRQLTVRPVKNAYSGYEPAFQGVSSEFEFTRLGAANLTGEPRGQLQRLHYGLGYPEDEVPRSRLDDDDNTALLLRSRWRILDRGPDSEPVAEPILDGVVDLTVRYYDRDTQVWLAQWPPASSTATPGAADLRLPQAVEVTLTTRTGGEMRRLFSLPDYSVTSSVGGSGSGSGSGGDDNGDDDSGDERSGGEASGSSSGSSGGADDREPEGARDDG